MSAALTCGEVAERELIGRYFAGRLAGEELEEFEAHLLTCGTCQRELRLAGAVRRALRAPQSAQAARSRIARPVPLAVGLAAAAALAGLLLLKGRETPEEITRLGAVSQAPIYLGVQVRGAPSQGDSLFGSAMMAYMERRYDAAADKLEAALAAGADSAPAQFFLGSSLLMTASPACSGGGVSARDCARADAVPPGGLLLPREGAAADGQA